MSRPYYADYVNHCLRFYFKYNASKGFKNEVDKLNYTAVDRVVKKLDTADREILKTVFVQDNFNIYENVSHAAMNCREDTKKVWLVINYATGEIAKERRLL